MEGGYFIPFPKPITHPEKCRWVQLCGRPHEDFNVEKVVKYTYICSKHFVGGAGPTAMYTDPIPTIQIGSSSVVKKSRPPRDRVTTTSTSESMTTFEHNYAPRPLVMLKLLLLMTWIFLFVMMMVKLLV